MLQNTGCTYFFRTFFSFNKTLFKKVLSYFMDEKNEAQGQHFSKVFESVNDESRFGFKSKSSMTIPLVDGLCEKCHNMLSE